MAIEINWSPEAEESLDDNISYLQQDWSEKEVKKFVRQTQKVINRIKVFPESYPPGTKNKKYRKARLKKYIVLFAANIKPKEQ